MVRLSCELFLVTSAITFLCKEFCSLSFYDPYETHKTQYPSHNNSASEVKKINTHQIMRKVLFYF